MASFRQRNGKWQARISAKGFPAEVKSFNTKGEAQRWAIQVEASMNNRTYQKSTLADEQRLFDILERYSNEVSPRKRGVQREREGIAFMQRQKMAQYSMSKLSSRVIAEYRDERLKTVAPGTIIRELSILSSIINHARKEWGLPITNPCDLVRKPPSPQGRNRILTSEEEAELLEALLPGTRRSIWMRPLVELALETAMRRGELLSLKWELVLLDRRIATLPITKNGSPRIVPLSTKAVTILQALPKTGPFVFPITHMCVSAAFQKARERAGISDLHFHDLRHTATSRIAEKLPNVIELASVTGHQTVQMLKRYYHPKAEALAKKLG